jgi:hypothetical protein
VRRAALCGLLSVAGRARAQADTATAEALFRQGRDLLRAGKANEACPKLAESERLDPATGTLLALAMCHQAQGKLASAWSEFVNVQARSHTEGRPDREKVARERSQALEPQLSTLKLAVPSTLSATPGLEILRGHETFGQGAWNVPVPIDGGEYIIEVRAPGKLSWRRQITIKEQGEPVTLELPPVLRDAPVPASAALDPRAASANRARDAARAARWKTVRWASVASAGAGVAALGVGGYFLASALGKRADSARDCTGNVCGDVGYEQRQSAIQRGNVATLFGIAGGALVAAGAVGFVVARSNEGAADTRVLASRAATSWSIVASPLQLGAQLTAEF